MRAKPIANGRPTDPVVSPIETPAAGGQTQQQSSVAGEGDQWIQDHPPPGTAPPTEGVILPPVRMPTRRYALDLQALHHAALRRDFGEIRERLEAVEPVLWNEPQQLRDSEVRGLLAEVEYVAEVAREHESIGFWDLLLTIFTLGLARLWDALTESEAERLLKLHRRIRSRLVALRAFGYAPQGPPPPPSTAPIHALANQQELDRLTNSRVTSDNELRLLNGKESFAERYALMAGARHSIHLQTLYFSDDETGTLTAQMLAAKARGQAFRAPHPFPPPEDLSFPAGPPVEVRVVIDYKAQFGEDFLHTPALERIRRMATGNTIVNYLRSNGVEVYEHAPMWKSLTKTWHQKLLIVDGQVGITGGMNVASEYAYGGTERVDASLNPDKPKRGWHDTDILVRGTSVHDMQRVFMENWFTGTRKDLGGDAKYFPPPERIGASHTRFIASRPVEDGDEGIVRYYLNAIERAERTIYIENSYFIPQADVIAALVRAARRGVDVQLVTNSDHSTDYALLSDAAQWAYPQLLQAGVRIFERHGGAGTLHSKVAIFDGVEAVVGSWNFNSRSRWHDSEGVLAVSDPEFAEVVTAQFVRVRAQADEITPVTLDRWGWPEQIKSWFWGTGMIRSIL